MKYTVGEFKKNTRKILNESESGAEVYITRYDQEFKLIPSQPEKIKVYEVDNNRKPTGRVAEVDKPTLGDIVKGTPLAKKTVRKAAEESVKDQVTYHKTQNWGA